MSKEAAILFPIYDVASLKTPFNVRDIRTVKSRLQDAGVPIRKFGSREVVRCQDLLDAALLFGSLGSPDDIEDELQDLK